ncbi:MAG: polymer-forming cytoskeletal protein [Gemmatimonadetes bacterium]|nr:polymer-forming cytoskeletal protein [Gemmatimonadota bacterium]
MSRLRDLAPEDLERLPPACRACTFWESATAPRGRSASEAAKIAWWQATQLEWGTPGKAVVVGKDGLVDGDVVTQDAVISGRVVGTLTAESRLELQATCRIEGEVRAKRMQLEEGALLNGTILMGENLEPPERMRQDGRGEEVFMEDGVEAGDVHGSARAVDLRDPSVSMEQHGAGER